MKMREIKFRGKCLDDGAWVYGDLIHNELDEICIEYYGLSAEKTRLRSTVDPDTVGQYTGLKDYNGKTIYEGDIIKIYHLGFPIKAKVVFKGGAFYLVNRDFECEIYRYNTDAFEVISNVHDHPEFLIPTLDR